MVTCEAGQTMPEIWQRVEDQSESDRPFRLKERWGMLVERERGIAIKSGLFECQRLSDLAKEYIHILYFNGFTQSDINRISGCSRTTIGNVLKDSLLPRDEHYKLRLQIIRDEELVLLVRDGEIVDPKDGRVSTDFATRVLGISLKWVHYLLEERGLELRGHSLHEVELPLPRDQMLALTEQVCFPLLEAAFRHFGHQISATSLCNQLSTGVGPGIKIYPVRTLDAAIKLIQPMLTREP